MKRPEFPKAEVTEQAQRSQKHPMMKRGDEVDAAALHAAFVEAFSDYLIGPFQLSIAQWPTFLGRQGVDLSLSRVVVRDGAPGAFCFVAQRPECRSWRLATMGATPAARGTGAAPALLDDFIERASQAGLAAVELECFAQNTRALRLYEGRGFRTVDALHGYELPALGGEAEAPPPPVDLEDAFGWLDQCGIDLPLQVTPRSLRALPGLQAFRAGSAQAIVSLLGDQRLQVHSLVDRDDRQREAEALLQAVRRAHPQRSLHVPQLQRAGVGGEALERLGAKRLPLHQVWMRRDLAAG